MARAPPEAANRSREEAEAAAQEAMAIYVERQRQAETQRLASTDPSQPAAPGTNEWCAQQNYPAPCIAPAPPPRPPQGTAHGEFMPSSCDDVAGNDTYLGNGQPRYNYHCGIYDWRCDPATFRTTPGVYTEPTPVLIGYVPYEVPEAPPYYPDNSEAGDRFSRTAGGVGAGVIDLIGQFTVTTGTGIIVSHYNEHRSCQWADAWGFEGYHEVGYRRSVQQLCYEVVIVSGPVAATWNYDPYPC